MKGKRNKGEKAVGFILGLAQGGQVLQALLHGLNMAIEHGGVGMQSLAMGSFGDLDPVVAGKFFLTGQSADPGTEDLGASAGNRSQTGLLQNIQGVGH